MDDTKRTHRVPPEFESAAQAHETLAARVGHMAGRSDGQGLTKGDRAILARLLITYHLAGAHPGELLSRDMPMEDYVGELPIGIMLSGEGFNQLVDIARQLRLYLLRRDIVQQSLLRPAAWIELEGPVPAPQVDLARHWELSFIELQALGAIDQEQEFRGALMGLNPGPHPNLLLLLTDAVAPVVQAVPLARLVAVQDELLPIEDFVVEQALEGVELVSADDYVIEEPLPADMLAVETFLHEEDLVLEEPTSAELLLAEPDFDDALLAMPLPDPSMLAPRRGAGPGVWLGAMAAGVLAVLAPVGYLAMTDDGGRAVAAPLLAANVTQADVTPAPQPLAPSTVTPSPTPRLAATVVVPGSGLNVCRQEGKSRRNCAADDQGRLANGERVTIVAQGDSGWYQLETASGERWWGFGYYLLPRGNADAFAWRPLAPGSDTVPVFADAGLGVAHDAPLLERRLPFVVRPAAGNASALEVLAPSGARGFIRSSHIGGEQLAAVDLE